MPLHYACHFQLIIRIPEQDQVIALRHTSHPGSQLFAGPAKLEGRFAKARTPLRKSFYKAMSDRTAPAFLSDIGRNHIQIVQRPPCQPKRKQD